MTKIELYCINTLSGSDKNIMADVYADGECPCCHYSFDFKHSRQFAYHDLRDEDEYDYDGTDETQHEFNIFTLYKCPHCHNGFVVQHKMKIINLEEEEFEEVSHIAYPQTPKDFKIDERINNISNDFYEVYKQSLYAKEIGLDKIYGMGLRKAMECLVKDFALYTNADTEEQIASKKLYNCIEDYIQDDEIKALANACRKIGNNETH